MTYIKKQKKGKTIWGALKLDTNKAYGRVDWNFLEWMLINMNFPCKWVHWIMQCVTIVSYFNTEALTKQATRIHNNPNLLISRFYKAKYKISLQL